jgi:catechol 2,3-dioxygenase-like lactoylglutathione lyase family enzyme
VGDSPKAGAVLYAKDMERVAGFYEAVLGLRRTGHDADHVVLESPVLQLVVLSIPRHIAVNVEITVPPARRERAAVKLVFFVSSLEMVRAAVEAGGGVMNAADTEWRFQGHQVCDGLDPEGNVVQFRTRGGDTS